MARKPQYNIGDTFIWFDSFYMILDVLESGVYRLVKTDCAGGYGQKIDQHFTHFERKADLVQIANTGTFT